MFVDREDELSWLERAWREPAPQLLVVYGRRRVGKTALLRKFLEGKPGFLYVADRNPADLQLRDASRAAGEATGDPLAASLGIRGFGNLVGHMAARGKRTAVLLDEFPYLLESDPGASASLKKVWDEIPATSRAFVVLCGSSVGVMETDVLGVRSPLYGRRTGQRRILPLAFSHVAAFFPGKPLDERLSRFAVAGGIPGYLSRLSPRADFWRDLADHVFRPGEFLNAEAEFLLREELREPRNYMAILRAIASGRHRVSEIVNDTGFDKSVISRYLSILEDLAFVVRETPATERSPHKSHKGLHRILDPYLRFWFRFVHPNLSLIEAGQTASLIPRIRAEWPAFLGETYETVAREIVRAKSARAGWPAWETYGRYWNADQELYIAGVSYDTGEVIAGEVRWSKKPMDLRDLAALRTKAAAVPWGLKPSRIRLALVSRSGFRPDLLKQARALGVLLIHGDSALER